ncbi:MAG: type II toxin-antitoxin system VapC family toxin [Candidatus Aminicenantia bacterium]
MKKESNSPIQKEYVFDSFAFITLVEKEKEFEKVLEILKKAEKKETSVYLSKINEGEIYYLIYKNRGASYAEKLRNDFKAGEFPIEIVSSSDRRVEEASEIKAMYPISYSDAFAAQLAFEKNAVLVTGDPEFKALEEEDLFDILWISK